MEWQVLLMFVQLLLLRNAIRRHQVDALPLAICPLIILPQPKVVRPAARQTMTLWYVEDEVKVMAAVGKVVAVVMLSIPTTLLTILLKMVMSMPKPSINSFTITMTMKMMSSMVWQTSSTT
jgi:hypothetical protein